MWNFSKEFRLSVFSLLIGFFLIIGVNSSFSQESFEEISDEDLELLLSQNEKPELCSKIFKVMPKT